MREYLYKIEAENGARAEIVINTDKYKKAAIIKYCGTDTGASYDRIGNAARHLRGLAQAWEENGHTVKRYYTTPARFIYTGCSEFNKDFYRAHYCGYNKSDVIAHYMNNNGIYSKSIF